MDDFSLSAFINVYMFAGYALFTFVLIIILFFASKHPLVIGLGNAANRILIFSGLLYFILWITALYLALNSNMPEEERASFNNRLYGPYSLAFWLQPICYIVLTQLLWFKWIAKNRLTRLLIGFLLFFSFEKFVIIVTSLHRDYLPSSWSMTQNTGMYAYGLLGLVIRLFFYAGLCVVYYFVKLEIEKKK